jgi:protocatechuate 3,4-dioxygenase beta subunit
VFCYVVDSADKRISGAIVQMSIPSPGSSPNEFLAESDGEGGFEFTYEFDREPFIWLAVVGESYESAQNRHPVETLSPTEPIVLVAFPNTASISGILVDGERSIQPFRHLLAASRDKRVLSVTDGAGAFHFAGLLPGTYSFYVLKQPASHGAAAPNAASLASFTSDNVIRAAPEVTITAGQQLAGVTLEIGSGGKIWGRVFDQSGVAVEGAKLMAWPDGNPTSIATAKTDADGNYEMAGIPSESTGIAELHVEHNDFESLQTRVPMDSQYDASLILKARLRGRVVSAETGEPITAFRVAAWTTDMPVADEKQAAGRLGPSTFTADDNGRFELSVRNGETTVGVLADGYGIGFHRIGNIRVPGRHRCSIGSGSRDRVEGTRCKSGRRPGGRRWGLF